MRAESVARTGELVVRTFAHDGPIDLVANLPSGGLLWTRDGEGLVAWGEAARVEVGAGEGRFERAARELEELFGKMRVEDEVDVPGTGPLAFGSFTFDEDASDSVLVVPAVVLGSREGRSWITVVGSEPLPKLRRPPLEDAPADARIRYAGSSISEVEWLEAVAAAKEAVLRGDLEKVVLARDVRVWSKASFDVPVLAQRLAARFPDCYTFALEGWVGATPELLVKRMGRSVESLVLAGSAARGESVADDDRISASLLHSAKDRDEHELALRSVREVLEPLCLELSVAPRPSLLRLANVQHLSTSVWGTLASEADALRLAGKLHPTAAVCGVPRRNALELSRSLEGLERGRYGGPVGWVDARGDGEWGIALRCAELEGDRGRLFAGAGIVAGSDPVAELEETRLKLRAMQSALEAS